MEIVTAFATNVVVETTSWTISQPKEVEVNKQTTRRTRSVDGKDSVSNTFRSVHVKELSAGRTAPETTELAPRPTPLCKKLQNPVQFLLWPILLWPTRKSAKKFVLLQPVPLWPICFFFLHFGVPRRRGRRSEGRASRGGGCVVIFGRSGLFRTIS